MLSQHVFFFEDVHPGTTPKHGTLLPAPKVAPLHQIFTEAILDHTSAHHVRSPLDWAISLVVHAAILILLVLVPLYFTQGLDLQRFNLTFLVAPMPPAAAPPPPQAAAAVRTVRATPKNFVPGKLTAPSFIPRAVVTASGELHEEAFAGVPGGVPGGLPGGQLGGTLGGVLGGLPVLPPPGATSTDQGPRSPVRVGGNVKPPRLLFGPMPDYPSLARQARIEGEVLIDAIIDEHGNVIEERVVSGHPLLIPAALKAASRRKYEPTILDGIPVAVDLHIVITFRVN